MLAWPLEATFLSQSLIIAFFELIYSCPNSDVWLFSLENANWRSCESQSSSYCAASKEVRCTTAMQYSFAHLFILQDISTSSISLRHKGFACILYRVQSTCFHGWLGMVLTDPSGTLIQIHRRYRHFQVSTCQGSEDFQVFGAAFSHCFNSSEQPLLAFCLPLCFFLTKNEPFLR